VTHGQVAEEVGPVRTILGREPAVFWAMVANLAMALLLLVPGNEEVHGALNAAVLALAGFLAAVWVSVDAALPRLTGVIKAIFAVVLAFGVHVPDAQQVGILAVVSTALAFFVRGNVTPEISRGQV
jgi:hypothetical protein